MTYTYAIAFAKACVQVKRKKKKIFFSLCNYGRIESKAVTKQMMKQIRHQRFSTTMNDCKPSGHNYATVLVAGTAMPIGNTIDLKYERQGEIFI